MTDASEPHVQQGLAGVIAAAATARTDERPLPPVHLWNPAHCGEINIRIARDGTWFHDGAPIGRPALVRLFSTVLRLDPDGFHLVTPAEKMRIQVEDAPFMAVRVDRVNDALRFTTNVGDVVEAGPDHLLTVVEDAKTGQPAPYVHVRRGLMARLTRPVFYELAALGETHCSAAGAAFGVWSRGAWFPLAGAEGV